MDFAKFLIISSAIVLLSGCGLFTQKHEIICTDQLPPPPPKPDPLNCNLDGLMSEATIIKGEDGETSIVLPVEQFNRVVLCLSDTKRFIEDQDANIQYCRNVITRIQEQSENLNN